MRSIPRYVDPERSSLSPDAASCLDIFRRQMDSVPDGQASVELVLRIAVDAIAQQAGEGVPTVDWTDVTNFGRDDEDGIESVTALQTIARFGSHSLPSTLTKFSYRWQPTARRERDIVETSFRQTHRSELDEIRSTGDAGPIRYVSDLESMDDQTVVVNASSIRWYEKLSPGRLSQRLSECESRGQHFSHRYVPEDDTLVILAHAGQPARNNDDDDDDVATVANETKSKEDDVHDVRVSQTIWSPFRGTNVVPSFAHWYHAVEVCSDPSPSREEVLDADERRLLALYEERKSVQLPFARLSAVRRRSGEGQMELTTGGISAFLRSTGRVRMRCSSNLDATFSFDPSRSTEAAVTFTCASELVVKQCARDGSVTQWLPPMTRQRRGEFSRQIFMSGVVICKRIDGIVVVYRSNGTTETKNVVEFEKLDRQCVEIESEIARRETRRDALNTKRSKLGRDAMEELEELESEIAMYQKRYDTLTSARAEVDWTVTRVDGTCQTRGADGTFVDRARVKTNAYYDTSIRGTVTVRQDATGGRHSFVAYPDKSKAAFFEDGTVIWTRSNGRLEISAPDYATVAFLNEVRSEILLPCGTRVISEHLSGEERTGEASKVVAYDETVPSNDIARLSSLQTQSITTPNGTCVSRASFESGRLSIESDDGPACTLDALAMRIEICGVLDMNEHGEVFEAEVPVAADSLLRQGTRVFVVKNPCARSDEAPLSWELFDDKAIDRIERSASWNRRSYATSRRTSSNASSIHVFEREIDCARSYSRRQRPPLPSELRIAEADLLATKRESLPSTIPLVREFVRFDGEVEDLERIHALEKSRRAYFTSRAFQTSVTRGSCRLDDRSVVDRRTATLILRRIVRAREISSSAADTKTSPTRKDAGSLDVDGTKTPESVLRSNASVVLADDPLENSERGTRSCDTKSDASSIIERASPSSSPRPPIPASSRRPPSGHFWRSRTSEIMLSKASFPVGSGRNAALERGGERGQ